MPTTPGILRNLRIKRVALVDNGANFDKHTGDGAHIMLFKSAVGKDDPGIGSVHVDTIGDEPDSDYEKANLSAESRNSLPDSAFAAVWTDAQGKKQRKLPIHDAGHLAAARGRIDAADIPASVKAAARRKIEAAGNRSGSGNRSTKKEYTVKEFFKGLIGLVTETDVEKRALAAAKLEKEIGDAKWREEEEREPIHKADDPMCKCADCVAMRATTEKAMAHDPGNPMCKCPDCVAKRTEKMGSEAVDKRFVAIEKENADLRKQAADAIAIAKAERETRLNGEMRTILKSFKATPFDDADVARFRKMQDTDKDMFDRTMTLLKAADAQAHAAGLYGNVGSGRSGTAQSAWQQIMAKAESMVEKSTKPLTTEQAIEKVMLAEPQLVAKYRDEMNAQ